MSPAEIIAAFESLPNPRSMTVSCSAGRMAVSFTSFTGVGRQSVRSQASGDTIAGVMDSAFDELQVKLSAAANP
jgi:hypothetical protein